MIRDAMAHLYRISNLQLIHIKCCLFYHKYFIEHFCKSGISTSFIILIDPACVYANRKSLKNHLNRLVKFRFFSSKIRSFLKISNIIDLLNPSIPTQNALTLFFSSISFNRFATSLKSSVGSPSVIQNIIGM